MPYLGGRSRNCSPLGRLSGRQNSKARPGTGPFARIEGWLYAPLPCGQDAAQISQFFVHVFGFKHRIAHDFA
jgi:hypothetical protein